VTVGRIHAGPSASRSPITPPGLPPYARYAGRYYWVADTPWDRQAFSLLYQAFQVTVTDVSSVGVPITISK
jgi:hypothetical protein